jgi:hypothetical protein
MPSAPARADPANRCLIRMRRVYVELRQHARAEEDKTG